MSDFKTLQVWQKAHALSLNVDRACKDVGVPHEMEAIVFDAMAKTPDNRPTAEQLGARLRDFLIKAPLQPSPVHE